MKENVTTAQIRRRARNAGFGAKWVRNGMNNTGIGEFMIYDIRENAFIEVASNETQLRECLTALMGEQK